MRKAQGPRAPAHGLPQLRRADRHGPPARGDRLLRQVRRAEPEQGLALRRVRQPGRPADEVLGGRVPGAGHDLLGPAQGHLPALRLRQGPGHRRQDDARRQGRGSLLRRHPPDDRARDVRHQRDRARHRVAAAPFARRLLHEGVGARLPREDHSVPRLVGRVRVRPEGRALRPHRPQAQVPGDDLPAGPRARDGRGDPAPVLRPGSGPLRARPRPPDRQQGRDEAGGDAGPLCPRQARDQDRVRRHQAVARRPEGNRQEGLDRALRGRDGRREGLLPRRRRRPLDRRGAVRGRPGARRRRGRGAQGAGHQGDRDLLPRLGRLDRRPRQHDPQGHAQDQERGDPRDLPPPAPGRPADLRVGQEPLRGHVLRRQEVRLLAGRPLQVQHQARGRFLRGHAHADAGGHLPRRRVPAAVEARRRADRRHRQPRKPARALGGRAAREPVPHRPRPDGARHQGEDVRPPGHRLGDAARPHQLEARHRLHQGVLRVLAAVPVHGPDEPALRGHAQAASLGPRAGRPLARARGIRGPRRASDALRPRLPDRDAGRPEHRPHLVAVVLRADQRLRLHRDPVQAGREGPRHRSLPGHPGRGHLLQARPDRREEGPGGGERAGAQEPQEGRRGLAVRVLPLRVGGRELRHRAGQRRDGRQRAHQGRPGHRPVQRRVHHGRPRQGRLQGHLAQAAGFGRHRAHPVPRARRREPRADGLQHAAPGRAPAQGRGAARRHRPRGDRGARLGRGHPGQARRHRRPGRLGAHHRARRERPGGDEHERQGVRRGHLSADEVPALEPEHLHQPEADRAGGRPRRAGPGPGRRPVHPERRARARPQRAGRLHAVARVQLRGRHPGVRAPRQGRLLHVDPHPGVRHRGPGHEARPRGNHARHPQRLGERAERPRRERDHPHRGERETGGHPGRQGHAEGRDPADARKRSCSARSSARRPATSATRPSSAPRASRERSST